MGNLRDRLATEMERLNFSKWGIGDISGLHPLAESYPKALSAALAFEPAFEGYDEAAYFEQAAQVSNDTASRVERLVTFFRENGISHTTVPGALQNAETLHAAFPHKLAATRAGLGWIGRNDLLVTPEFGPRVRLGTILFDAEVATDAPVTKSHCGACTVCVSACPSGAVRNALWSPGIEREELVSVQQCTRHRAQAVPTLGRNHACGFCVLSCPRGG